MRFLKVADFNTMYNFLEIPNPWYDIFLNINTFTEKILTPKSKAKILPLLKPGFSPSVTKIIDVWLFI